VAKLDAPRPCKGAQHSARNRQGATLARVHACTIIARNYLPHARVLARSFQEHNPSGQFTVLLLDDHGAGAYAGEPFEVLTPHAMFDEDEFLRMAAIYDVMELATAVKPTLLKHLLDRGESAVTYLDPDIEIFAGIEDIDGLAAEHGIVLTPHTLDPLVHDYREPGELTLLLSGQFNLGFVAVGPDARPFLDWWSERLARDCRVEPAGGLFVDQRWVDFVPALFDHHVLRDRALNVAHWNLETREFDWSPSGYTVDGEPLRFFHFSGFDPAKPYLLSKFLGPKPAILLSEKPALARICAEYADKLYAAGYGEEGRTSYAFDWLPSGVAINARMRKLYRLGLAEAESESRNEGPPNPLQDADGFLAWLNEPVDPFGRKLGLSRYLADLYETRPDLQRTFPDPWWPDAEAFAEWVRTDGRLQDAIPFELVPPPGTAGPASEEPAVFAQGANVVGYFRAEAGIGEVARQLVRSLEQAGVPYSTITNERTPSRQQHDFTQARTGEVPFDINLICVNADELPRFVHDIGPDFFAGRHSIGFWAWELEEFPERFVDSFPILSEVWAISEFARAAIAKRTTKPVYAVPLGVEVPHEVPPLDRARFGIPDAFMFLFMFDFLSVVDRKNPAGLVRAFVNAFDPDEGPVLVLKCVNADRDLRELEQLRALARGRRDVVILDEYVSRQERDALVAGCDCYVSLHRSEGLGLTMAEAMAQGKPVIATAYSGNLAFMTEANSFLVPYTPTTVPPGRDPYPQGATWADPNLDAAGALMRHVYESPEAALAKGERARADILANHSAAATARFIEARFKAIWAARAGGSDEIPAPAEEVPDGLERATEWLSRGPSNPIRARSRFGHLGLFARRLLYRILRPYAIRQREFELAVVDAVRELDGAVAARLQDEAFRRDKQTYAVEARIREDLRAAHERMATDVRGVAGAGHPSDLAEAISVVGDDLKKVHAHVLDVSEVSVQARRDLDELAAELRSRPFMADRTELWSKDEHGHDVLAYTALASDSDRSAADDAYRAFEDIFRGPEDFIRDRQRVYVDLIENREPVVDLGCGRGEFLDLLAERGIAAVGVDLDSGMARYCLAKGHTVEVADAIDYLDRQDDATIGAIFASQLIEHLEYEQIVRLFEAARRTLKPGGVFICETVNPHSVPALKSFWVDLTHQNPVFPEVALALAKIHGFAAGRVLFPNGVGTLDDDLRQQGEYALVAAKTAAGRTSTPALAKPQSASA
jgi:glycosyltransferase involved in cell wall biosynthesis/SAM-dependent methyltransferase